MAAPKPPPAVVPEPPIGLARELILVATGGMLGALLRAAVGVQTVGASEPFPLATQIVNGLGAAGLGVLLALLEGGRPRPALRRFLGVGVLGSFTTFSTLVDDGRVLATDRSPALALAFLLLSLAMGLIAFRAGRRIGSAITSGRPRPDRSAA